jgi:hypothetical protein
MVSYYEHLAAEHDPHAAQSLVQIYSHGSKAVPVDMSKVVKYLRIAATGGCLYSLFSLLCSAATLRLLLICEIYSSRMATCFLFLLTHLRSFFLPSFRV